MFLSLGFGGGNFSFMLVIVCSSSLVIIMLWCVFEFVGIMYYGVCLVDVVVSVLWYVDWQVFQCLCVLRLVMLNFQCLVGLLMCVCNCVCCLFFEMCRKYLMIVVLFLNSIVLKLWICWQWCLYFLLLIVLSMCGISMFLQWLWLKIVSLLVVGICVCMCYRKLCVVLIGVGVLNGMMCRLSGLIL